MEILYVSAVDISIEKNKIPYYTLYSNYSTEHVLCQLSVSGNYEVIQFYFPGKTQYENHQRSMDCLVLVSACLRAYPTDHSPHLRCSPVLEGYQLEECQILCHQSVHQKPQTEFRLPIPPPKLFPN